MSFFLLFLKGGKNGDNRRDAKSTRARNKRREQSSREKGFQCNRSFELKRFARSILVLIRGETNLRMEEKEAFRLVDQDVLNCSVRDMFIYGHEFVRLRYRFFSSLAHAGLMQISVLSV